VSAEVVPRLEDILGEVEVLVRVLGEVEAVRPAGWAGTGGTADEQVLPARQKGLEALVYLALSDVGVSRRELERVLFPTGPASERVLYNTVKSVLKVVGDHQPAATTGRHYVLSERVVTDYGIFCDLAAAGERADDPGLGAALLGDALALVRGEPFSGISRGYTWAAAHRATMVAQVVDVAERLAALHMTEGAWHAAEEAARRGLLASPGDERLEALLTQVARG
jgi:DNA-binding SARP family transcriptional activator